MNHRFTQSFHLEEAVSEEVYGYACSPMSGNGVTKGLRKMRTKAKKLGLEFRIQNRLSGRKEVSHPQIIGDGRDDEGVTFFAGV